MGIHYDYNKLNINNNKKNQLKLKCSTNAFTNTKKTNSMTSAFAKYAQLTQMVAQKYIFIHNYSVVDLQTPQISISN